MSPRLDLSSVTGNPVTEYVRFSLIEDHRSDPSIRVSIGNQTCSVITASTPTRGRTLAQRPVVERASFKGVHSPFTLGHIQARSHISVSI